jgi:hypothetical protein
MDEETPSVQDALKEKREESLRKIEEINKLPDRAKPMAFRTRAIIHMTAMGVTKKEIARQMNLSEARIHHILSSESAKKEVERIQHEWFFQDPQKMFRAMVPKAAKRLNKLISKEEKGSTQLGAIGMVLDRALGKAVQPVEVGGSAIKELLMALDKNNRPKEDKPGSTDIVEAEYKEIQPTQTKDDMDSWLDENL